MARCLCRVMLAMALPRRLGNGVMLLPSHAGDGATEATWPWRDIIAEPCWRWHCQDELAMARCRCRVMLVKVLPKRLRHGAMLLPSRTSDSISNEIKVAYMRRRKCLPLLDASTWSSGYCPGHPTG
jgi:hypothetical protein